MADAYYFTRDDLRRGPYSAREMRKLAASGDILQTDTVWRTGLRVGTKAERIPNLFPPTVTEPAPALVPSLEEVAVSEVVPVMPEPVVTAAALEEPVAETPSAPPVKALAYETPARKGTARAGKGATIVGQDGVNVKFKKKCTTCGFEAPSWQTSPIRNGVIRAVFFCIKCKKSREVEVHGTLR